MCVSQTRRRQGRIRLFRRRYRKWADELGSDGRILVRESGTEPLIRVMVEAATDEICEKHVDSVVEVIKQRDWQSKTSIIRP